MTAPRESNGRSANGRVLKWLPLAVVALSSAVAWGAQLTTTQEHERRITHHEKLLENLTQMQSRIDERTQNTGVNVRENKTLMLEILRELRNGKGHGK